MNESKKELYAVFTSLEIKVISHDCLSRSLIKASSDCLCLSNMFIVLVFVSRYAVLRLRIPEDDRLYRLRVVHRLYYRDSCRL